MARILASIAVLMLGCGGGFDPVGTYEGTATKSGQSSRMTTDLAPGGTATADVNRYNQSENGPVVTVRRLDERHLEVDIGGGCKIRVQQSAEPNEISTITPPDPNQRCRIEIEGFSGDVDMSGTANFTREDPPSVDITFHGQSRSGDSQRAGYHAVDHNYLFTGRRRAQ